MAATEAALRAWCERYVRKWRLEHGGDIAGLTPERLLADAPRSVTAADGLPPDAALTVARRVIASHG